MSDLESQWGMGVFEHLPNNPLTRLSQFFLIDCRITIKQKKTKIRLGCHYFLHQLFNPQIVLSHFLSP